MSNRVLKEFFTLIPTSAIPIVEVPDIPASQTQCCSDFVLKVLADDSGEDLNNDRSGFLWWFNDTINSASLVLQQFISGVWTDVETLSGANDFGTSYDYEFYVNDAGESFIGYQLNWADVLADKGEAMFRVKCVAVDFASVNNYLYSPVYCLKTYTAERANGTIRVEYYLSGSLGINENDEAVRDLGSLNWYNSFRLPGYFGFNTSTYEETRIQYQNGERLFVTDDQEPEFTMKLKPVPYFIHEYMRTDVMMSDNIEITDYNSKNPINLVRKKVFKNSGYAPQWKPLQSKLAGVEVKFKQTFNNHKKLRY